MLECGEAETGHVAVKEHCGKSGQAVITTTKQASGGLSRFLHPQLEVIRHTEVYLSILLTQSAESTPGDNYILHN